MKTIRLEAAEGGCRIDSFIAGNAPELTRSAAQRLIEAGKVTLNGAPVIKKHLVRAGECFIIELPDVQPVDIVAQEIPLVVVYEDADLIVINKPVGMVVHPAAGHEDGTLVNALLAHCGDSLSGIGGERRPGIVHRIDKDTSGLLIAAKNDFAHTGLAEQLKDHSLYRVYEAIVCGNIRDDSGTIDAPIGRHPTDRKRMAVTTRASREAVTHFEVIARYNGYTHVRCRLETGRTHQIRVHMAHRGNPILGDTVYGRKKPDKGMSSQCLHARTLSFIHPRSGERITLTSELPEYFKNALTKLGEPVNI